MFLVVTLMIAEFALGLRRGDPEFTSFDWKSKDSESDDDDIYLSIYLWSEKKRIGVQQSEWIFAILKN